MAESVDERLERARAGGPQRHRDKLATQNKLTARERIRRLFDSGGDFVEDGLLAGTEAPDYFVDISDYLDRKIEAVYCHTSQIQPLPKAEFMEQRRRQAVETGRQTGTPLSEAFRRVTLRV